MTLKCNLLPLHGTVVVCSVFYRLLHCLDYSAAMVSLGLLLSRSVLIEDVVDHTSDCHYSTGILFSSCFLMTF